MLIQFSVANFRSIKDRQTLSMAAAKSDELIGNTFDTGIPKLPRLVRSAAIYGANAAGKSNLLNALDFMRKFVLSSTDSKTILGGSIAVSPFLFDKESQTTPSEFEIIFIQEGIRYQYGFTVDSERVLSEWLFVFPEGRPQNWINRIWDQEQSKAAYKFGSRFLGNRKVWKESTRPDALFLSTAVQLNCEQLKPIFEWFENQLFCYLTNFIFLNHLSIVMCEKNEKFKNIIISYLKIADATIEDIKIEKISIDLKNFAETEHEKAKDAFDMISTLLEKPTDRYFIFLLHKNQSGDKPVYLSLNQESQGTRNLFALAGILVGVLLAGNIVMIDELDSSFHPLMLQFLLNLVNDPEKNTGNGQLIFTTHDTTILDKDILRRDQVWFVEKDEQNATVLYPLSDFKPRKEESLGRNYLKGRYGAIPFIGEWNL